MTSSPQIAEKQSSNAHMDYPLITETILRSVVKAGYVNNLQILAIGEGREYIIVFLYGKNQEQHALGTARNELKRFKSLDTARSTLVDLGILEFKVGHIDNF